MGRIFTILGILFLVWMGYRFLNKTWSQRVKEVQLKEKNKAKFINNNTHSVQKITSCAYCKTHVPENEGIHDNGHFFCSLEHLDNYNQHLDKNS